MASESDLESLLDLLDLFSMESSRIRDGQRDAGWRAALKRLAWPLSVLLFWIFPLIILDAFFGPFFGNAWGALLFLPAVLLAVHSIWRQFRLRRRAGPLLLSKRRANARAESGPSRPQVFGWAAILLGVTSGLGELWNPSSTVKSIISYSLLYLLTVVAGSRPTGRRFELRRNGILSGTRILPWSSIEHHEIDMVSDTLTVKLRAASRSLPSREVSWNLPFADQDEVDEILVRRGSLPPGDAAPGGTRHRFGTPARSPAVISTRPR